MKLTLLEARFIRGWEREQGDQLRKHKTVWKITKNGETFKFLNHKVPKRFEDQSVHKS